MGVDGLKNAYETGRGKIKMCARAHIESAPNGKDSIVITEVTYQTNKSNLVEKIADLVRDKKIVGITDLRDESDKDGIRIVVETKRDAFRSYFKPAIQTYSTSRYFWNNSTCACERCSKNHVFKRNP